MSKNKYIETELREIFETEQNYTRAAKKYCELKDLPYDDSVRRQVSTLLRKNDVKEAIDADLDNDIVTETNQYANDKESVDLTKGFSAIDKDGSLMTIERYCESYGLNASKIRSYKLISHTNTPFYNIAFYNPDEIKAVLDVESHLEELIQKYIRPVEYISFPPTDNKFFDRLVYSDCHIAMDVQGKDGDPLYDGKWDKEEVLRRLSSMIEHTISFKKGNVLYIDELGDFLDGLGGETTRKGHKLPQNMNDKEAFELAVDFKVNLVEQLVPHYNNIVCNMVTNDNHSGVFGYFVGSAVKRVLEAKYPDKVSVNVLKRFMEHYSVGSHTFILTHGKDIGENKFGMKPKLDAVLSEKIDQ